MKKEKYFTDYEYIATSPLFDEAFYRKQNPDVAAVWQGSLAMHYYLSGWKEGRDPGPNFDTRRYLRMYQGKSEELENMNPLAHYERYGKALGFVATPAPYTLVKKSEYFDERWYRSTYAIPMNVDAVLHYLNEGWKAGYNPSLAFNGEAYLDKYPGVRRSKQNPLMHYERNGRQEGRVVTPCIMPVYEEPGPAWKWWQKVVLSFKKKTMSEQVKKQRILVCMHLFYPESWKEIKWFLHNLDIYNYDLYLSYPEGLLNEEHLAQVREFKADTHFFACENRGYDIGPFVEMLNYVNLDDYDIVFKLHSKGIKRPELFMYHKFFMRKEWFTQLFRGTIGILNTHRTIKKLADPNNKIGMVACENLIVKDPSHKQNLVNMWCENLGIPMEYDYDFVAGTCFAERSVLLKELKKMNLTLADFDLTTRGEFSMAHGLERIVCMHVKQQGYTTSGNPVRFKEERARKKEAQNRERYAAVRLLDDDRFIIDDNFFYRLVEGRQVESYELVKIRLGDIIRIWEGKKLTLDQCAPYLYLMGYRNEYYDYCDFHRDNDLPEMTKQRFDTLISSIEENGFNDKYKIIINQDNVLQDGQHRACYYTYKYGIDHEVEVLRIHYRGQ